MIQVTSFQELSFPLELADSVVPEDVILYSETGISLSAPYFSMSLSSISPPLSVISVTFSNIPVGKYYLAMPSTGRILESFEVVDKLDSERLKDIEDEALGSWAHDKGLGKLTLFRQDGTILATFNVIDTVEKTSREVSP